MCVALQKDGKLLGICLRITRALLRTDSKLLGNSVRITRTILQKDIKQHGIRLQILFFRPNVDIFLNNGAPRLVHSRYEVATRDQSPEARLTSHALAFQAASRMKRLCVAGGTR